MCQQHQKFQIHFIGKKKLRSPILNRIIYYYDVRVHTLAHIWRSEDNRAAVPSLPHHWILGNQLWQKHLSYGACPRSRVINSLEWCLDCSPVRHQLAGSPNSNRMLQFHVPFAPELLSKTVGGKGHWKGWGHQCCLWGHRTQRLLLSFPHH